MDNELISASISDRGLSEKRPQNEDSFAELPQFGVFAVADGVGGANAGDFASRMAMELLTEAAANQANSVDAEELLRTAITHANRSIYQTSIELPQLSSMATTIVVLHLKGNIATLAHVGDSRIYRFTPDGQGFRETNDHSVVEEEVRAGRMTPEEAAVHPSRNVISRAVGAEENVEIDFKTIMVEPNTTFLLCSDGITRHIPDDELQSIFASGAEPRLICEHLKEVCYSRGAEDNLTALIVRTFAEGTEQIEDFDSTVQIEDDDVDFHATVPVLEEDTIATARTAYATASGDNFEASQPEVSLDDTIAEIDTDEFETGEHPIETQPPANENSDGHAVAANVAEVPSTVAEEPEQEPQFVEPIAEATTDEQFLLTETEEMPAPTPHVIKPASAPAKEREFAMFGSEASDAYEETGPSKRGAGRILLSVLMLILGGAIAVGGSYFLGFIGQEQPVQQVPQVETMKTQNIPLTEFEESRRTVDKDPAAYLRKVPTSTDAADFYLRGRALLLTGKPEEARIQFQQANDRMSTVDEAEKRTLSNEIALGLAVLSSAVSIENFKKSVESSNTNSNANANIAVNANTNR